jgi:hypothetical protein
MDHPLGVGRGGHLGVFFVVGLVFHLALVGRAIFTFEQPCRFNITIVTTTTTLQSFLLSGETSSVRFKKDVSKLYCFVNNNNFHIGQRRRRRCGRRPV